MSASDNPPAKRRPVSGTENSWCRAHQGGTGTTVLALLLNKPPNFSLLQTALHTLQSSHPLLRSTLQFDPSTATFSFLIPPSPTLTLHSFDPNSTTQIIEKGPTSSPSLSSFQILLEHELNNGNESGVLHASVYAIEGEREGKKWAVMMRLHTGACDRTAAVTVLKDLMRLVKNGGNGGNIEMEKGELNLGIEEYIPSGKMNKPFWARGVDLLGYSLNSFRFSNLDFVDPDSPRCSRVVRLLMDSDQTRNLLQGCKTRRIKLCGALAAAALMAARLSKKLPDGEWEKYAVVSLIDCRKLLEPPLSNHHVGFYHSAILDTHDMCGGERLWDLARRVFNSFNDAKDSNKHFTDMADLNLLMCKAIENPGLTPSSSLRTSFISVFEDPVIDETNESYDELGIEDCVGCASVHGVGPSIAVFDTIRNGRLDCACVYPFPLHSREQMQELIDNMKKILVASCN